jgi:hypothetical protein
MNCDVTAMGDDDLLVAGTSTLVAGQCARAQESLAEINVAVSNECTRTSFRHLYSTIKIHLLIVLEGEQVHRQRSRQGVLCITDVILE